MNENPSNPRSLRDTLAEGIAAVMAANEELGADPERSTWPISSSKNSTASGPRPLAERGRLRAVLHSSRGSRRRDPTHP